jgi:transposase
MTKSNKFSPEVRERAVRMVQEHRGDYPSLWSAIESIAVESRMIPNLF